MLANIVTEMGAVPDYNVLILDYLAVDEFVDAGFGPRAESGIVDFDRMIAYDPQVPAAVDVRDPICRAGNDLVGFSRLRVADTPFAMPPIIAIALDFVNLLVPVSFGMMGGLLYSSTRL